MFQKYRAMKLWKKAVLFLVAAALGVVAHSLIYNRPIHFRPKWAPGSIEALRPSGDAPDNIVLVPAGDMSSSVSVTWRTSERIPDGVVQYRRSDGSGGDWTDAGETPAARTALSSPELRNDNTVHFFSAVLTGLTPGAAYSYRVGSRERNVWSDAAAFTTAEKAPASFSFVALADTQGPPKLAGVLVDMVEELHPGTAFFMSSGDIVDEGELRNQWDDFLATTHGVFSRKPFAPAMGNHDYGDHGTGAAVFNACFNTPGRNAEEPMRVENYSFRYGAACFIVINGEDLSDQTEWLEQELRAADAAGAKFKIVMFHRPVYTPNARRSNGAAQREWAPLFDKYAVDLVLTGHDHSYVRSRPLRAGVPVPDGEFGTTYVVSTACNKFYEAVKLDTSAVQLPATVTCQVITLSAGDAGGAEVRYRAYSSEGEVVDEFAYTKQ